MFDQDHGVERVPYNGNAAGIDSLYLKIKDSLRLAQVTDETKSLIEEITDINCTCPSGNRIIHNIAANNDINLLKYLISERGDLALNLLNGYGLTPLMVSINEGNSEVADILLEAACDVNVTDFHGKTAIFYAIKAELLDILEKLIPISNVNKQDIQGLTPLSYHFVTNFSRSDYRVLELLLNNGADINIQAKNSNTPLHYAIYRRNQDVLNLLFDYNPNFDLFDSGGVTSLHLLMNHYCVRNLSCGHRCPMLAEAFRDITTCGPNMTLYAALRQGANPNIADSAGDTPFHYAVNNLEIACMCLYYGANPNILNEKHESPILLALKYEEDELAELMFFTYGGLFREDRYGILECLLARPRIWQNNEYLFEKCLEKFQDYFDQEEHYVTLGKVELDTLVTRWDENELYACILECLTIVMKVKSKYFSIQNYFSVSFYYDLLLFSPNITNEERLKIIWLSLSCGITANTAQILDAFGEFSLGCETEALCFGGDTKALLDDPLDPDCFCADPAARIPYFQLLNSDLESEEGKRILMALLTNEEEFNIRKLLQFFSLSNSDAALLLNKEYENPSTSKYLREATSSVKSLQELSRNKTRAHIKKEFNTQHFYHIHKIINDLKIPPKLKQYLQFRSRVRCFRCSFSWCQCPL